MAQNKISKKSAAVNKPKAQLNDKPKDLITITDNFFSKHGKKVFWIGLAFTCLFSALLFELKISEGTDDSGYVMAAQDFIKGKAFPTWHGSFYPIFLSLPMLVFGMNLFWLKFMSFFLMVGHFVFLYLAFRNRVSPTVLALVLLLTAINADIVYFSSSTYSEPLFYFLQGLSLLFFFKIIDVTESQPSETLKHWKLWLAFGLSSFLLSITRNVGLGIIISFSIYFLFNKQFKEILLGVASFAVFQIPYSIYKSVFWKQSDVGFESQFNVMFQKDAYNSALGNEDLMGFVSRFWRNSELYLSKHIFKVLGIRSFDSIETSTFLTVFLYALFIVVMILAFKNRNKIMQFLALYLAVAIGGTFVSQQVSWDQVRLIIVYIPVILIFLAYGLLELSKDKRLKILQVGVLLFFIFSFFVGFGKTSDKVKVNRPILSQQMKGNKYAGFTPDWVHFFQISEWAAQNIPAEKVIASRKPSMSFIYSKGRYFAGIYQVPVLGKDSTINKFIQRKAEVIILDNYELEAKQFPAGLFEKIRPYNSAMFISDSKFFTLYEVPADQKGAFLNEISLTGVTARTDLVAFNNELNASGLNYFAEDADYLVSQLKQAKINYIILASLRANSLVNNGNLVNTIHRYMLYIQLKYPNMFRVVYQVGDQNDEPAQLLEVVY